MPKYSRPRIRLRWLIPVLIAGIAIALGNVSSTAQTTEDWRSEWELEEGFDIEIDSVGFDKPTSIAFVPNPGKNPKDPLYFVTELRMRVSVVTNDRTVITFAKDFFPDATLREHKWVQDREPATAGICLDPTTGYVFVTFAYSDSAGIPRNNMVRFTTTPKTFSTIPGDKYFFTEIFSGHRSSHSHQIGPCKINNGVLTVSVGDANQVSLSQQINNTAGKVLRMTVDGLPSAGNPYKSYPASDPASYVWASGFRNPFGLAVLNEQVFIADNGHFIDRFLRVEPGGEYLWDGTDTSIGAIADLVLYPGSGVAQLDYLAANSNLFPENYANGFYLTITGGGPGSSRRMKKQPSIVFFQYDLSKSQATSVPRTLVRSRSDGQQVLAAMAFGPDGLYFAAIAPNYSGITPVYRVTHNEQTTHPYKLTNNIDPFNAMTQHGCFACHILHGNRGGNLGPVLDQKELTERLLARLNSSEYYQTVSEINLLDEEPYRSTGYARQEVLAAEGFEKVRRWLKYTILEPGFDDTKSIMPNLDVKDSVAEAIADFLVDVPVEPPRDIKSIVVGWLPTPSNKNLLFFFIAGFVSATALATITLIVLKRVRR